MTPILRLLGLMKPYRRYLLIGLVALVLSTPAQLFHPLVWKFIIDDVVTKHQPHLLVPALLVMFGVHLVGAALSAVRTYALGVGTQRLACDLRNQLYARVQAHSMQFFHERRSGDLIARLVGDVDSVQEVLNSLVEVLNSALQFVMVAAILIYLDWRIGLLTLLPMAGVFGLVMLFNNRIRDLYRRVRDRLGDVSAKLSENLLGVLVIKAFAREEAEAQRFSVENERYLHESLRGVTARTIYFPSVFTVGFLSSVAMIGVGAQRAMAGALSVGSIMAFSRYWWQLFQPVYSLATTNEMVQRANAAASRIFELLDAPLEITDAPDALELAEARGALSLRGVSFTYPERDQTLTELDLVVPAGASIGVVGPSGAGKSTLVALLLRLYDPQAGQILVDGHDLRAVTQTSLRRHYGVVTQEPFLFNASVRHNIAYAAGEAGDEQIIEAARQANAHDFIEALPEGYDTVVGERGVKLSGGQKQRICIARAFLANPAILLLDEATAAVEPESEAIIQSALERLMAHRTSVTISHRLSMVRGCDQIAVICDGRLAQLGRHDELMAQDGWYQRMYRLQMGGGELQG
ncbi:MAG: ABC transporter ATP-binding protein [Armatimonadetes bacterium]|nr:ABC transporter ATP-binding protein [Armatimonadota bacterium]